MIRLVISGGQTGADQAGWRAAQAYDVPTGGWMPKGFLTEDGPWPEFARWYGAREHTSAQYPPRTAANVHWADATVIFHAAGAPDRGCRLTAELCRKATKPHLQVEEGEAPEILESWLRTRAPGVLNVAGTRESRRPGFGILVETTLRAIFRDLARRGQLATS